MQLNLRASFSAECLSINLNSSNAVANPIKNGETSGEISGKKILADNC